MANKDTFAPTAPAVPVDIGPVHICFDVDQVDVNGVPTMTYAARYSFDQKDASGAIVEVREGPLVPHLTPTQLSQAKNFLDAMRAKARATVG